MEIPKQFRRETPDFAVISPDEVWGPFVIVHPIAGEILGSQLRIEDNKISWIGTDDMGKMIVFDDGPYVGEDGSISVSRNDGELMHYTVRPLTDGDSANFGEDGSMSIEEIYAAADEMFAPFVLEDDDEDEEDEFA